MPSPTPAPMRRPPWLGMLLWLGLIGALGGIGWAVLSGCGIAWLDGRPVLTYCPTAAEAEPPVSLALLEDEQARQRILAQRLERLRVAMINRPACPEPEPEPEPIEVAELSPEPEPEPEPPPTAPLPRNRPEPPPLPEPPPQVAEVPPPAAPPPPPTSEFDQRVARDGGQRGNVQVTLIWDNGNDLDLHVYCPDGSHIWYAGMYGCGGALDIDANAGGPRTFSPVENVTWPGGAPSGTYRVEVDHFANHGGPEPSRYRVRVRVGENEQIYEGAIGPRQGRRTITFVVP